MDCNGTFLHGIFVSKNHGETAPNQQTPIIGGQLPRTWWALGGNPMAYPLIAQCFNLANCPWLSSTRSPFCFFDEGTHSALAAVSHEPRISCESLSPSASLESAPASASMHGRFGRELSMEKKAKNGKLIKVRMNCGQTKNLGWISSDKAMKTV